MRSLRLQWGNSGSKSRLTASEINRPQRGGNPLTKSPAAKTASRPLAESKFTNSRCPTAATRPIGHRPLSQGEKWPRRGAGGRAWPGPKLAERIKHRLPFALHVGEMLEETHFHSHIV